MQGTEERRRDLSAFTILHDMELPRDGGDKEEEEEEAKKKKPYYP